CTHRNTSVSFILHESNEGVFILFSFFSGSATLDSRFYLITFFTKFLRNAENTCHIAILNYLFMSSMFK
ncbi:TPA: hypothetical protein ACSY7D_13735, partial [Listeria monocytogenes]